ncbi:hypothetical protein DFJ74DRAFT_85282 [Hyaloraphidium curvatum]|nr:hypothetical protein DFJ74DRAFT_85282 [Hyaloraphidium curvatum]
MIEPAIKVAAQQAPGAPPLASRRDEVSVPKIASLASLPPEVLLLVMENPAGRKRSLLNLLSTCRGLLTLGIEVLLRRLVVDPDEHRPLEKWRGLLMDGLELHKLEYLTEFRVSIASRDPLLAALLDNAAPSLAELHMCVLDPDSVPGFLRGICRATKLRVVSVDSPTAEETDADDFVQLLEHLESLPTFESFELSFYEDCGSSTWPEAILAFPNVFNHLRTL